MKGYPSGTAMTPAEFDVDVLSFGVPPLSSIFEVTTGDVL
jgi:hypothetical protein